MTSFICNYFERIAKLLKVEQELTNDEFEENMEAANLCPVNIIRVEKT